MYIMHSLVCIYLNLKRNAVFDVSRIVLMQIVYSFATRPPLTALMQMNFSAMSLPHSMMVLVSNPCNRSWSVLRAFIDLYNF
jgi:hypothetical protein